LNPERQTKLTQELHQALKKTVHVASTWARGLAEDPHLSDALREKATTILTRISGALTTAEASFPLAFATGPDMGDNSGMAAMIQETDGGGVRLFVHGELVRSVGFTEAAAVRRLAERINAAAERGE